MAAGMEVSPSFVLIAAMLLSALIQMVGFSVMIRMRKKFEKQKQEEVAVLRDDLMKTRLDLDNLAVLVQTFTETRIGG